jgi:hypothetical protein
LQGNIGPPKKKVKANRVKTIAVKRQKKKKHWDIISQSRFQAKIQKTSQMKRAKKRKRADALLMTPNSSTAEGPQTFVA